MSERTDRLRLTLQGDGGSAETAFKELLSSELTAVFKQFMDLEDLEVSIENGRIDVRATGDNFRKVGFYSKW